MTFELLEQKRFEQTSIISIVISAGVSPSSSSSFDTPMVPRGAPASVSPSAPANVPVATADVGTQAPDMMDVAERDPEVVSGAALPAAKQVTCFYVSKYIVYST